MRTVQRWVKRAGSQSLAKVEWASRPKRPQRVANKTAAVLERQICAVRQALAVEGALGFCGAQAVAEALKAEGVEQVPSVRTINRILAQHGLQDAHARVRRKAPVPGWYLPAVREWPGRVGQLRCH